MSENYQPCTQLDRSMPPRLPESGIYDLLADLLLSLGKNNFDLGLSFAFCNRSMVNCGMKAGLGFFEIPLMKTLWVSGVSTSAPPMVQIHVLAQASKEFPDTVSSSRHHDNHG